MQTLIRYFMVGGTAAIVDLTLFYFISERIELPYLLAGAASFVVATIVNYVIGIRFVFQSGSRFERRLEIILVFVVSGIGLALHQCLLFLAVDHMVMQLMLAKLFATASVFLWNFGARRFFVFGSLVQN